MFVCCSGVCLLSDNVSPGTSTLYSLFTGRAVSIFTTSASVSNFSLNYNYISSVSPLSVFELIELSLQEMPF